MLILTNSIICIAVYDMIPRFLPYWYVAGQPIKHNAVYWSSNWVSPFHSKTESSSGNLQTKSYSDVSSSFFLSFSIWNFLGFERILRILVSKRPCGNVSDHLFTAEGLCLQQLLHRPCAAQAITCRAIGQDCCLFLSSILPSGVSDVSNICSA